MNSQEVETARHITLSQAFGIGKGEVISLVGGGGKTTLMFALARELSSDAGMVVTTTTTRILEPSPAQTPRLLVEASEAKLLKLLLQNADSVKHVTLARRRLASGKLEGVSPEMVASLAELRQINYIIVEADGAAQRPLKAPNLTEPVIPANTSLVIPVVGIDAVGCRLTEATVFRPEIASTLLGLPLGEVISLDSIAILLTHRRGIIKGSPKGARIVPFINKVDSAGRRKTARELAVKILAREHPQIRAVVSGLAQAPEPVIEVVKAG